MEIRLKEPQRYRALLVDSREGRDQFLECLLADRGIVSVGTFMSLGELNGLRTLPVADLLIIYMAQFDMRACQDLGLLAGRFKAPVMVMIESDSAQSIEALIHAGAHSVVSIGTSSDRLRVAVSSALSTHEKLAQLQKRAERAESALAERKLVERAKGILMQQRGISEHDALRQLQRTSMERNQPLPEVSRTIIAAKELLG